MTITKRLSLNEIRARVAKFVVDYREIKGEKQYTQQFWSDLLACYGVESTFLHGVAFEYPARRADTGGQGFVDVFMPGRFLIEQKSEGKISRPVPGGMSNAEMQARAYLLGGDIKSAERPRWVVTSDFSTLQVTDLSKKREDVTRTLTIATRDLIDHVESFLFLVEDDAGDLIAEEQAEASVKAAKLMGTLYSALTGDADVDSDIEDAGDEDVETMEASIVLTRLLFLLFGDDANLWDKGLFHRFIKTRTAADGSDLGPMLAALFDVLNTPEEKRDKRVDAAMAEFPYVNGELYSGPTKMQYFDSSMRDALLACCDFDWSRISPAVFGSLFQTVKSKEARHSDGEHYTSEENILKTLGPMFLDEFRARLESANSKPRLRELHDDLRNYRYVDAACGCGNFLIVAYRELRTLELDLLVKLRTLQGRDLDPMLNPGDMLNVRLDQFYGIELNWWPAKIAETAMFLVDHQANQQMAKTLGLFPKRLPIKISANIVHANALTTDWGDILPGQGPTTFVFGNPPFQGRQKRSDQQAVELASAWDSQRTGHLDFVTAWHAKALKYFANRPGEFALVTTNSITQGEPVGPLFNALHAAGWRLKFAHRPFQWRSESASKDRAAVHCVIVGFTRDQEARQRLFTYDTPKSPAVEVKVKTNLNGYLVTGPNKYAERRSAPLSELPSISFGSMPRDGGFLVVKPHQYAEVMADPVAAKYVRRYIGGDELIKGLDRWCLWMLDLDPQDVTRSAVLKGRIEGSRQARLNSSAESTREWAKRPHQFVQQAQPSVPYLAMPRVFSESRPYATVARLGADVIASDQLFTCPDPDGFAFAVISSSTYMAWQHTVGGRHESRLRFSKDIVWNNLPLPAVDAKLRIQIIAAGAAVIGARAKFPRRSLAEQYNPLAMDSDLLDAHVALDRVVDRAFGVKRGRVTFADRQQALFDRFVEMATGG